MVWRLQTVLFVFKSLYGLESKNIPDLVVALELETWRSSMTVQSQD